MIILKNDEPMTLNRANIIKEFYNALSVPYEDFSPLMGEIIEKTKDIPITKRRLSYEDRQRIKRGEGDDIPRYEIKGYDDVVCSATFEKSIKDEFCALFAAENTGFMGWLKKQLPLLKSKYVIKE